MTTAPSSSTLEVALSQVEGLIASIRPEDGQRPTPCAEWVVRDLVDHVVGTTSQFAAMARGEEVDWTAPTPHHEEPVAAFHQHADDLLAAIEAGGIVPENMPAAELSVHTWDLATALGRSTADLDPQVAEAGYAFMAASLTDEMRGGAFAPAQQPPAGANAYERIAAFAGRDVAGSA